MYSPATYTTSPYPVQQFLEVTREICKKRNVQATDIFLQKIIQTYEMMIVRHGYVHI